MAQYKSRVRSVEAFQVTDENMQEMAVLTGGQIGESRNAVTNEPIKDLRIPTMGGIIHVTAGCYLIRSSAGTWHVLNQHTFEREYEEEKPPTFAEAVSKHKRI